MHAHARPPLNLPQRPLHHAHSLFLFRSFTHGVCRPPGSFFPAHTGRYTSLAKCAYQNTHSPSSLLTVHAPYVQYDSTHVHTPAPLFIDLILAHSSPLDIVGLSHHLLAAPISPCLSLRTLFSSNTCMHVYVSISLHIARSIIIRFPHAPIDLPH